MELCQICGPANSDNMPGGLPPNFKYVLCENKRPLLGSNIEGSFFVVLRTTASTGEEALRWLKDYSTESRTVWRVQCSHHESGLKNVFKAKLPKSLFLNF